MANFNERIEEIAHAAEAEDISRATRRLLDLCMDYGISGNIYDKAMDLRIRFNMAETSTKPGEARDLELSIRLEILNLLDEIKDLETEDPETSSEAADSEGPEKIQLDTRNIGRKTGSSEPEPFLVFEGKELKKRYRTGPSDFALEIEEVKLRRGEITGIVGENGNGKTTLLRIIAGDLASDSGSLRFPFMGENDLIWENVKHRIAYIPQRLPRWWGNLIDNLKFAASIHGIHGKANQESVKHVVHRLGLSKYANAKWGEISTGYKLRFELARALVWHPELLVLDEPLANLDINTRDLFLQDLRFIVNSLKFPTSIIISSQQLHEVEEVSDNIIFLEKGHPLYLGRVEDFGKERQENVFELTSNAPFREIKPIIEMLEGVSGADKSRVTVIRTPLDITGSRLLQHLIEHNIEVTYFREISHSTRKLFRQNHA